MCAFGARWRKPTGLLFGGVDPLLIEKVFPSSKLCKNINGMCEHRRGHKHIILTGTTPQGVPWTRIAQAYPKLLAGGLARLFVAPSVK
jgi:hypothetical protein